MWYSLTASVFFFTELDAYLVLSNSNAIFFEQQCSKQNPWLNASIMLEKSLQKLE